MLERKYLNRLVGKTSPGNVASQNILLKCGARRGETLKDATGGIQGMTAEQQEFYRESLRVLEILQRIKAATEGIPQDIRD